MNVKWRCSNCFEFNEGPIHGACACGARGGPLVFDLPGTVRTKHYEVVGVQITNDAFGWRFDLYGPGCGAVVWVGVSEKDGIDLANLLQSAYDAGMKRRSDLDALVQTALNLTKDSVRKLEKE